MDFGGNGAGTTVITFTQPTHGSVALDDGGTPNDPTDDVLVYTPKADVNNIKDSFYLYDHRCTRKTLLQLP